MGSCKLTKLLLQKMKEGNFQSIAEAKALTEVKSELFHKVTCSKCCSRDLQVQEGLKAKSLLEASIHKVLRALDAQERLKEESQSKASIYKVPSKLRLVETQAFIPNIISIGPYHHGEPRLQAMEAVKWKFFDRLFDPNQQNAAKNFKDVYEAIEKHDVAARDYYSDSVEFCKEKFVEIMMVDGCFVVQLFRQLRMPGSNESNLIKRWMMPFLRRDLIMLENQIPMVILKKIFSITQESMSLEELALNFFKPLMHPRGEEFTLHIRPETETGKDHAHLLDLFRSSLLPKIKERNKEPHIFHSVEELKEAFIKIKKTGNCKPLDIGIEGRVLKIPPLYFNDYTGTLYRNLVAFEQCHNSIKPDVTRYLLFLDGLINSAKDVEILHYAGVLQHSLGNNKEVARLVNKLCKEVAPDIEESYLFEVVGGIHKHCNKVKNRLIAILVHNYFCNLWVGISTVLAAVLLCLTLVQTCCAISGGKVDKHFWTLLGKSFRAPFSSFPDFSNASTDGEKK
ncbi:hypothetical protein NMG60_11031237 [Bertholletia excelsa]